MKPPCNLSLCCQHFRELIETPPCRITAQGRQAMMKHGAECWYCQEFLASEGRTVPQPKKEKP